MHGPKGDIRPRTYSVRGLHEMRRTLTVRVYRLTSVDKQGRPVLIVDSLHQIARTDNSEWVLMALPCSLSNRLPPVIPAHAEKTISSVCATNFRATNWQISNNRAVRPHAIAGQHLVFVCNYGHFCAPPVVKNLSFSLNSGRNVITSFLWFE